MISLAKNLSRDSHLVLGMILVVVMLLLFLLRSLGSDKTSGSVALPRVNLLDGQVATSLSGAKVDINAHFHDHFVLIVNIATKCGFTELNFRELQRMFDQYSSKKFVVLAFPCNQFGGQEPGSSQQSLSFAEGMKITFPMFEKLEVNGALAHPLFVALKKAMGVADVEWNYGKFLLAPGGLPLRYYDHRFPFEVIDQHVEELLLMKCRKGGK